jgi:uncharacterized membrane protein YhaH (DUF805 family)
MIAPARTGANRRGEGAMDEANRFAPPATAVADVVAGEVQPIRFWPPNGRIGRLRFLAYGLGLYAAFIVASFAFGFVASLFADDSPVMLVVAIVGFAAYLFAEFVLIVQRSHDMNISGWWSIAALVPLVGLIWVLKAGTRGANRWGPPPPPNGVGVRIVGWVLPALIVIGIVAAIALPAYQQAATRGTAGTSR